jgi:hypothetical protein
LKELTKWLGKQGLDPDIVHYAKSQIDEIVLGKVEDDEEDQTSSTDAQSGGETSSNQGMEADH